MNKFARIVPASVRRRAAVAAGAMLPVLSFAQEAADPFQTALDNITTKVGTYGAALVGLAAVAVVFYVGIKFVKKIPKAA